MVFVTGLLLRPLASLQVFYWHLLRAPLSRVGSLVCRPPISGSDLCGRYILMITVIACLAPAYTAVRTQAIVALREQ